MKPVDNSRTNVNSSPNCLRARVSARSAGSSQSCRLPAQPYLALLRHAVIKFTAPLIASEPYKSSPHLQHLDPLHRFKRKRNVQIVVPVCVSFKRRPLTRINPSSKSSPIERSAEVPATAAARRARNPAPERHPVAILRRRLPDFHHVTLRSVSSSEPGHSCRSPHDLFVRAALPGLRFGCVLRALWDESCGAGCALAGIDAGGNCASAAQLLPGRLQSSSWASPEKHSRLRQVYAQRLCGAAKNTATMI